VSCQAYTRGFYQKNIKTMGLIEDANEQLSEKGICRIRAYGESMRGRIESGQRHQIMA